MVPTLNISVSITETTAKPTEKTFLLRVLKRRTTLRKIHHMRKLINEQFNVIYVPLPW